MANDVNKEVNNLPQKKEEVFKTALIKAETTYIEMVTESMSSYKLPFTEYQKTCVMGAIQKIYELLQTKGLDFKKVNQSNLSQILSSVAALKLNPVATPRECYFQLRNVKQADDTYIQTVEMGIEGAGNDAILRNFGVDVKSVMPPFIVHDGDELSLPFFDGEKMTGLTWKPKTLSGKVTAVIYVISKEDGSRDYAMADRESVAENLKAHIINNLRAVPDNVKNPILDKIENMTLDEMLSDKSLREKVKYTAYNKNLEVTPISPAWTSPSSREAMIERKIRNNAIKKYPKNFGSDLASTGYENTYEDYDQYREAPQRVNPIDAVDAEFEEKAQKETIKPVEIPTAVNNPTNEEIAHNEPNSQTTPSDLEDMPF